MDTLMLILSIVGILVSGLGAWLSWKAMTNAMNAQKAAETAIREIKVKKNIVSLSEVISFIDRAINTLNKRLSNNTERGANINTENQLLRDCSEIVNRHEERIKDQEHKLRVRDLRKNVDKKIPKYKNGDELHVVAEEIVSNLKEIRQIFTSENENAIY